MQTKQHGRRFFAVLLTLAMLLSAVPLTGLAVTNENSENMGLNASPKTSNVFHSNSNTENATSIDNKFLQSVAHTTEVPEEYIGIYTTEDLLKIDDEKQKIGTIYINNSPRVLYAFTGNYILMNDLTIDVADFSALGGITNVFTGTFDGNGYSIKGLTDSLFYRMGNGAVVRDLALYIDCNASVIGGLSRYAYDVEVLNCYIEGNIKISGGTSTRYPEIGSVSISSGTYYAYAGGLIGYAVDKTTVNYCYSNVEFSINSDLYIASPGDHATNLVVGGITGRGGNICNSYNSGNIICEQATTVYPNDKAYVIAGGISGEQASIETSCNTGNITVSYVKTQCSLGGICGEFPKKVKNSFNTGNISLEGIGGTYYSNYTRAIDSYLGGIVGCGDGTVDCCYNIGRISTQSSLEGIFIHPVCAYIQQSDEDISLLSHTYYLDYNNEENNALEHEMNIEGLSFYAMQKQSSFSGFDFNSVWVMEGNDVNYRFPKLQTLNINLAKESLNIDDALYFENSVVILSPGDQKQLTVYCNEKVVNDELEWINNYESIELMNKKKKKYRTILLLYYGYI